MEELIVAPFVEVIKCFASPIKLRVGYLFRHEKKIEKLKTTYQTLKMLRSELQHRVEAAERNLERINPEVTGWFLEVDTETTRDEKMAGLMNARQALDGVKKIKHFTRRYGLGKLISKKTVTLDELIIHGRMFSDVSSGGLVHGIDFLPKDPDFESFPSRESVVDEVKTALGDDGINLIGVYGMGGIGKTMFINEICNQVKDAKLFKVVVIVTVSQNVELKKIQDTIAEALECDQAIKQSGSTTRRASVLTARLMMEQSVLIVLDDLWTDDFNLHHVGIPYGQHKGCKVVVTSRIRREYCGSHEFQKNIEVKTIEEDESWGLFTKKVGDVPSCVVAREIVRECNGLPIALVVLGRALSNKDTFEWERTATQLKESQIKEIHGMNSLVYNSIKLSYDFLKHDIQKRCFLLCCLFPENHKITVDSELMMYFICDTNLRGFTNLKKVRGRLHTVLQLLTDSCLLLRNEKTSVVWMHDITRDVAISIASEEHGFLVQAGKVSTEWSNLLSSSSDDAKFARLSLMRSSISSLPDRRELTHLVSMSLEGNETLKDIPDGYFQGMEQMETLDLRSTGISKLPPSLSFVASLRTLYLDYCVFAPSTDISLVGHLKKLVILSLQGCNLERLPTEIGELTGLKSLNLSRNKSLQVPPNVISKLSQLEELYMKESFSGWEIEGWKSRMKAGLEELTSLLKQGTLTTLHFSLYKSRRELLSEEDGPSRIHLDVMFGQRTGLDYRSCYNFLALMVSPPICQIIMVLLERVETLKLKKSNHLKSVAQIVPTRVGFRGMKSLGIEECNGMVSLMSAEEAYMARNTFSAMEYLVIRSMDNFEQLFDGPVPIGFIEKLKRLTVTKCSKMVSIFDSSLLKRVPNLDALKIDGCKMLSGIFNLEAAAEPIVPGEGSGNVSTFFNLRKIYLRKLQSLEFICKGVIPDGAFDNLRTVELHSCDRIKHLFSPDIAAGLGQLEELKIQFCQDMVKLIAAEEGGMVICSSTAVPRIFPRLETLLIESCESFEQLWDAKAVANSDKNPVLLPELLKLELKDLPELTDLHHGSSSLECPRLQHLEVVDCENLKRIWLSHRRTPKLKKIVGNDETWFRSIEWENASDKQHMHHLFQLYDES